MARSDFRNGHWVSVNELRMAQSLHSMPGHVPAFNLIDRNNQIKHIRMFMFDNLDKTA